MIKSFTHVVVDGSNMATEGRTEPSLKQLNEAVLSLIKEFPNAKITVVVDASFGHRVDRSERAEFDEAINNNELVAPPAGAVGRGDGFVLTIADKVKASVLSNDSYQEFHDQYKWLFDEGRLIGGKPVPNVGWVFVQRLPVRKLPGRETAASLRREKSSVAATRPMPVPKSPPPKARVPTGNGKPISNKVVTTTKSAPATKSIAHPKPAKVIIDKPTAFAIFKLKNPIGTKLKGVVNSYASHGVNVLIGEISGYLPLRLMANPAPLSAREHVKLGASLNLVVVGFLDSRYSVELAIAGMEHIQGEATKSKGAVKKRKRRPQKPKLQVHKPAPKKRLA